MKLHLDFNVYTVTGWSLQAFKYLHMCQPEEEQDDVRVLELFGPVAWKFLMEELMRKLSEPWTSTHYRFVSVLCLTLQVGAAFTLWLVILFKLAFLMSTFIPMCHAGGLLFRPGDPPEPSSGASAGLSFKDTLFLWWTCYSTAGLYCELWYWQHFHTPTGTVELWPGWP